MASQATVAIARTAAGSRHRTIEAVHISSGVALHAIVFSEANETMARHGRARIFSRGDRGSSGGIGRAVRGSSATIDRTSMAAKKRKSRRSSRPERARHRSGNADVRRTRLELILDRVTPEHEVTIDADGYTRAQVDRIIVTAKARGLHVSGTNRWLLIRTPPRHANANTLKTGDVLKLDDGREWRVLAIGARENGATDVHLASVALGQSQKNGHRPLQICGWLRGSTLAGAP